MTIRLFAVVVVLLASMAPPASGSPDDAGSGGDAGDSFAAATSIEPRGRYDGRIDSADDVDFYRFDVPEGTSLSVAVFTDAAMLEPIQLLDPNGVVVDMAGQFLLPVGASTVFTHELEGMRVAVHRAVVGGEYRLRIAAGGFPAIDHPYELCFMNCEEPRDEPIQLIFGGSLKHTDTRVLLVPPAHGDLGNPLGPTVLDYIDATRRGMHAWTAAIDRFVARYPRYSYLQQIEVHIEVFDGVSPVDPAGYDVIVGYVAAGPAFRGVASDTDGEVEELLESFGLDDDVHYSGRVILLSLFGAAPRAGQVAWDFPEVNDLEVVTMHEFGHTFGVGHTLTWHPTMGPDLMNSPATFVYGDGFAAGDGGERTPITCLSSLNLVALAQLYEWLTWGTWIHNGGWVSLPNDIPYERYC